VDTNNHVKATVFKLTIFLTESTGLAAAMNQAIRATIALQTMLSSHLGSVEAGVYASTTCHTTNKRVQSPTRTTCYKSQHRSNNHSFIHHRLYWT